MKQPILSEQQLNELMAQLGRLNGRFTRDGINEYHGSSIEGLMVTDPNYGSITYQARFPCWIPQTLGRWPRRRRYETQGDVHHWGVLETDWMAANGLGCMSGMTVFLPQYPDGPEQFARAVQSITNVQVTWHFVERELVHPHPVDGIGTPHLQHPANNNGNPPELLVHQDQMIRLRNDGAVVFGTGQRINAAMAVLVSMYYPYDREMAQVQQAEVMDGWFRYHVKAA